MTIDKIWKAIKEGKTVCWGNESYEVHPKESNGSQYAWISERDGVSLRVSCVSNYFGSYLCHSDIANCYVVNKKPHFPTNK